ncbi:MAG: transcription-repair coupling factor [Smithellaceae bacterium]|nr:transcription-repair coupling factor [Syntrophaceae bacterium]MDD4239866.1 transcription-repair coupling factor [Smithellaceae bacterium]
MRKIIDKKRLPDAPPLRELYERIGGRTPVVDVRGLAPAARPLATALVYEQFDRTIVVVCPTPREAELFARDLGLFLGPDTVLHYPPLDFLSIDMFALQREEELARLSALTRLQVEGRRIFVTSFTALMQKVMPLAEFQRYLKILAAGDPLLLQEFPARLAAGGYSRVALVEEPGEFSLRGNILDIFPPTEKAPLRLEIAGDDIETIRRFDAATQRSGQAVDAFVLGPAGEILVDDVRQNRAVRNVRRRADDLDLPRDLRNRLVETLRRESATFVNPIFLPLFYEDADDPAGAETLSCVFDYLPSDALFFLSDPLAIDQTAQSAAAAIDKLLYKARAAGRFYLESANLYLSRETLAARLAGFQQIRLIGLALDDAASAVPFVTIAAPAETTGGETPTGEVREEALLRHTAQKIQARLAAGQTVFFFSPTPEDAARMKHLLEGCALPVRLLPADAPLLSALRDGAGDTGLFLREGKISGGFSLEALGLAFVSEEELFVRKTVRRRSRPQREGYFLKSFGDLAEGDFVVHRDFGIGRYRGLKKISVVKIENDFMVIEYAEGDKLYLPVNALDRIQRYLGPDGHPPKIDKMGGTSWDAVKERVRKSVRDVAEELVAIYAAREALERKAFAPPDRLYEEFCATFEFEETPDQARAIEDIHADMDDAKPMDRLICGDAGFGKTEVALRAAFRAVLDGRQAALLAPTTILAEQHYATFSRRLADFPVRVEALNRFKSAADVKKTLADLRLGRVDIVVGTHRLLSKDVEFNNLGLVIIDEEQRFGVTHKEKLKKLRTLVDVLTLSATPIPRTLHLSLVGIRDLSIINTPPQDRRPIKTYVLEFDEDTIRTAVDAELHRGGQVFFVHDRVRSIYSVARLVQRLVPNARVGVVHGQMKPAEIEKTMAGFIRRECDVLVCTTIIGSGLDIPSANTIFINRADRFGLAQLYQIRGRVGRGSEEASAYLLLPRGALLSRDAMRRLQAIKEFSDPGSGFRIAYNDLEIRGGGNLLGLSQAGHISAVGYELYTELMERTVREIQGQPAPAEEEQPEISLGVSAFLPEDYVEDVHQRLILYKRISHAGTAGDLAEIRDELADCYGPLPEAARNLLRVIGLRNTLKPLAARKMGADGKFLYLYFKESSPLDPARITALGRKKIKDLRFTPDFKLFWPVRTAGASDLLDRAEDLLKMLAQ